MALLRQKKCSCVFVFAVFPLQVLINNGFTPDKEDYEFCTKVDNMVIPSDGFFGISAATGGLAGIILFAVKSLYCLQNQNFVSNGFLCNNSYSTQQSLLAHFLN